MTPEWLLDEMRALASAHAAGRLPHAILIQGSAGIGGEWLAGWLSQLVLCSKPGSDGPCGQCRDCQRAARGQHPDRSILGLIEDSKQIRVDQVRELARDLGMTSHQGGYKVGILSPADAMNLNAANALLKTLEEPPPRTLLVLVAAQPSRLPATIHSRCQRIRLRAPTRAQSVRWLEAVRGAGEWDAVLDVLGEAPFTALQADPQAIPRIGAEVRKCLEETAAGTADPLATAERWSRSELPLRLTCFENWLTDRIRRQAEGADFSAELRPGAHLPRPDVVMNIRRLFELLESVRELAAMLDAPINRSLQLENLLRRLAGVRI